MRDEGLGEMGCWGVTDGFLGNGQVMMKDVKGWVMGVMVGVLRHVIFSFRAMRMLRMLKRMLVDEGGGGMTTWDYGENTKKDNEQIA
jgi:hypothetical protein